MTVGACGAPGNETADTGRSKNAGANDVAPQAVDSPVAAPRGASGAKEMAADSRPRRTRERETAAATDTARGIVAVVGAVPATHVVLRASGGPFTLTGSLANEISAASGADVWVSGRRLDDRTIEVTRYAVRTVDGVSAVSGTLVADGGQLVLITDEGRSLVVAQPPDALREHVGARVWISGDLSGVINAHGLLRPKQ